MENTLYPDDVIWVNKFQYGPKLPHNPFDIPWLNLIFFMNEEAKKDIDKRWWPYRRFKGIDKIKQSDLLVYQLSRTFFVVKRCVAVAGDTLSIVNGKVYRNDLKYTEPPTVKNRYDFKVTNTKAFFEKSNSLGLNGLYYPMSIKSKAFNGMFTKGQLKKLIDIPEVYKVKKDVVTFNSKKRLFSIPPGTKWTQDNMGPFMIPKKGATIRLTPTSFAVYKSILKQFEKVEVQESEGVYIINGEQSQSYTFKQDYFFVMGDNRKGSLDSRYVGFIPEEHIIGEVGGILFSNNGGTFKWDRFLKNVE